MTIIIGSLRGFVDASETEKDFFDVAIDGTTYTIANNDGVFSVYNAKDSMGNSAYGLSKDLYVEVLP